MTQLTTYTLLHPFVPLTTSGFNLCAQRAMSMTPEVANAQKQGTDPAQAERKEQP